MVINHTHIIKESARGYTALSIADELFTKRVIFFTDQVNAETCCNLNMQLMQLESLSHEPITLVINSPGGDVTSGMSVYDTIMSMKSEVHTCIAGIGASMGAIIFLAGKVRSMLPHSKLMLHDPSFGGGDLAGMKPLAVKEDLDRLMQTREMLGSLIAERTGHPLEEIYELTQKDCYMTAEEAVKFGACTGIANFDEGSPNSLYIRNTDV